ncbi:MAG: response regulator [Janthinobacterium lividum]
MTGGGRLKITALNSTISPEQLDEGEAIAPGRYVLLAISDNGAGIPKNILERVLEPFFTTKEVGKGNGLGLSLVYGFVRQSGGHVRLSSQIGRGTTVRLYLPQTAESAKTAVPPLQLHGDRGHGQVILVVEDDPGIRKLICRLLTMMGYRPIEASDGNVALQLLHATPYVDLLLTDITMPNGMDGFQLAKLAHETTPELKIVFMSGFMKDALPTLGQKEGTIHLLPKPFGKAELAKAVLLAFAI